MINRHLFVNLGLAGALLFAGCKATSTQSSDATPPQAAAPAAPTPFSAPSGPVAIIDGKDAPVPDIKMGDPAVIQQIIREGRDRSQVMELLTYLTQKIGPRLTGSTRATVASNWCRDLYAKWGLSNPRLFQWGTIGVGFDRGPSSGVIFVRESKKQEDGTTKVDYNKVRDIQFSTLAWTSGTNGPVRGPVIKLPKDETAYAEVKDSLKGAWILIDPPPPVGQRGIRQRLGTYYDQRKEARKKVADGEDPESLPITQRLIFHGVAGFISTSRDERVWTGACPGWRDLAMGEIPPDVHVSIRLSDYDYINSRLADGEPIEVEFNLDHKFFAGPAPVYDTLAEIPGTEWPDQIVVISAHLDSWDGPGSQGCTDNGTGTAVTLEAARILSTLKVKPKRTIRFVNWTGEEQGLLGSQGYLKEHPEEWDRISVCFVDDGGTDYEGGLGAPDIMIPMLAAATAPSNYVFYSTTDGKWLNVNIHSTGTKLDQIGGSDHASFNAKGIPGFFWDEVGRADYGYGWHTQNDKLDLAIPEYLVQSATNAAITAYNLACADTLLPRMPKDPPKSDAEKK